MKRIYTEKVSCKNHFRLLPISYMLELSNSFKS